MDWGRIIEKSIYMKDAKKIDGAFVVFIGANKISQLDGTIKVYSAKEVAPFFRTDVYWRAF